MFAILRQASGRRHEVDFNDDLVVLDVAMSATTVQITMPAAEDGDPERKRFSKPSTSGADSPQFRNIPIRLIGSLVT